MPRGLQPPPLRSLRQGIPYEALNPKTSAFFYQSSTIYSGRAGHVFLQLCVGAISSAETLPILVGTTWPLSSA